MEVGVNGLSGVLVAMLKLIALTSLHHGLAIERVQGKAYHKRFISRGILTQIKHLYFRSCNNPAPRYGGYPCTGQNSRFKECNITIYDPYPGLPFNNEVWWLSVCSKTAMANHWTMDVARLLMCVTPGMDTAPRMTSVLRAQDVAPTIVLWSTPTLFLRQTAVCLSVKQGTR